jgi:hypothetical protein
MELIKNYDKYGKYQIFHFPLFFFVAWYMPDLSSLWFKSSAALLPVPIKYVVGLIYWKYYSVQQPNIDLFDNSNFSLLTLVFFAKDYFDQVNTHVSSNSHAISASQHMCRQWLTWPTDVTC